MQEYWHGNGSSTGSTERRSGYKNYNRLVHGVSKLLSMDRQPGWSVSGVEQDQLCSTG